MKRTYKSFRKSYPKRFSKRRAIPAPANKCVDVPNFATALCLTPTYTLLNGVAQGAAFYQRLGNRFRVKAIHLKAVFYPLRTTTALSEMMRVMIVYDRQANGAAPVLSDLLLDRNNAGTTGTDPLSGINIDKRSRYTVLYDFMQELPSHTVTGAVITNVGDSANGTIYKLNKVISFPNGLTCQCDGATAAIGDIETGSIYMITFGNVASGSEGFTCNSSARVYFADSPN